MLNYVFVCITIREIQQTVLDFTDWLFFVDVQDVFKM